MSKANDATGCLHTGMVELHTCCAIGTESLLRELCFSGNYGTENFSCPVGCLNLSCESPKGDSRSEAGMTALYTFCRYAFQVLLRQRRAKRNRLRDHFRADKQAAARLQSLLREECFSGNMRTNEFKNKLESLNLSCESNAFQGVPLWNPHK